MSDIYQPDDPQQQSEIFVAKEVVKPPKFSQRGPAVYFSWAVIVFVTVGMFCLVMITKANKDESKTSQAEMMSINTQAKMTLGAREFTGSSGTTDLDDLNLGSPEQRYGIVLLKNEIIGADAAEELLLEIDKLVEESGYELSEKQIRIRTTVGELLDRFKEEQWDTSFLPVKEREYLVDEMGWVGELALAPKGSPDGAGREALLADAVGSFIASALVLFFVGCTGLLGVGALITVTILLSNRRIKSKFFDRRERSAVYLETFAIWIFLFFVTSQFAVAMLAPLIALDSSWVRTGISLFIFFGSLVVLMWPVFRGLTFTEVRQDIGWTCSNPLKEVLAGFFSYLALAPVIGLQLIVLVVVTSLTMQSSADSLTPTGGGSHPIQDQIATGDSSIWVGVFLLAVVAAPIVEETMFRGVFYRYLKDLSNHRRVWVSVVFACLVNGVIFAALHPQGLVGIPFLTTIAIGVSLARQWRDSLIASITMHAINNGILTTVMFLFF